MKINLKNTILTLSAIFAFSCSQQDIVMPVDFDVILDPDNVYKPGHPIHFKFTGDADYMVFYSGETGHEYRYKDRTYVPMDEVNTVSMNVEYTMLWGAKGGLDVYVSNAYDRAIFGLDGTADREAIKKMVDGGLDGWHNLGYANIEGDHEVTVSADYDLSDYAENFAIAFHWHPNTYGFTRNQGTYHINGEILMNFGNDNLVTTNLRDVQFDMIVMNEQDPPYLGRDPLKRGPEITGSETSIGTCHFDSKQWAINFEGINKAYLDYEIDVWVISRPMSLNSVKKDTGVHIKNMMNPIYDYEHIYEKPGTYKAVFYGVNDNYQGHTSAVREVTVIIADDPVFE